MQYFSRVFALTVLAVILSSITVVSRADQAVSKSVVSISSSEGQSQSIESGKQTSAAFLWNLQDADILSIINEVSQETGKNFAVDPRVSGKITLISNKAVRRDQVYQVFLSILSLLGYSAIPSGDVIKIVPNMESGEIATKLATSSVPGKGDEEVASFVPLSNVSATQLIPVLRPLLPQWSNISSYTPGNTLILVGRAANIQRIVDIVQEVDQASSNRIEVVPLHKASAV